MQKPTPEALAAFDSGFPADDERAERRKMFGMPAGFVNGNMFYGVFAEGVVLRLPAERLTALSVEDGIGPFEPMPGRPWKEYVHVDAVMWGDTDALRGWTREALDHTAAMPPKVKKPRTPRKKG